MGNGFLAAFPVVIKPLRSTVSRVPPEVRDGAQSKSKCPPNRAFVEPYTLAAVFVVTHSLSLKITAKTTVPDVTGNWHASGVRVQKTGENPCYL